MRVADRRIGHPVVAFVDGVTEHAVGNAAESIGTAKAFLGGVEAAVPVVHRGAEQAVEHLLEVRTQLFMTRLVVVPQHRLGEALEFDRVVIGEGHTHTQRLAEAAALQGGHGGGQRVQGGTAVDTDGLALVTQFAGVAGGAGDIQELRATFHVLVTSETDRQVAGIERAGLLLRIGKEAKASQVVGSGEFVGGEGQLQRSEPVVAQAFDLGALRCVVVGLARFLIPLAEVMDLAGFAEGRQIGVGDVVEHHGASEQGE